MLDDLPSSNSLDVFLITYGGTSTVPWQLACLIREYVKEFTVLVPYPAMSAGTSLAIGANEIVMGRLGTLGPVDPKVANEFNPRANNVPVGISVEDVSSYHDLITDLFKVSPEHKVHLLQKMPEQLHPLALGNVYRHYQKAREDTERLLAMHMDSIKDKSKVQELVKSLISGMKFHGHPITRRQAKELGLKIRDAETITEDTTTLEVLVWELYKVYEADMEWMTAYRDDPPAVGGEAKLLIKAIESAKRSCAQYIVQDWRKLPAPGGSVLTQANNMVAIWTPGAAGIAPQVVPIVAQGPIVQTKNGIYEKKEHLVWEGYK